MQRKGLILLNHIKFQALNTELKVIKQYLNHNSDTQLSSKERDELNDHD